MLQRPAWVRRQRDRFEAIMAQAGAVLALVDDAGVMSWVSGSVERILGRVASGMVGRAFADLVHPDDAASVTRWLFALAEGAPPPALRARVLHGDGAYRWFDISGRNQRLDPLLGGLLLSLHDVTEQQHAHEALRSSEARTRGLLELMAKHDALTGLPNRYRMIELTNDALSPERGPSRGVELLVVDLDRFKLVNETLGHQVGDELLRQTATRLRSVVPATDVVGRLGGDEFVVLGADVAPGSAVEMGAAVQRVFEAPFELADRTLYVTASVGTATAGRGAMTAGELLRRADTAMHTAKTNGRGRVERYDVDMTGWVNARLESESALRLALERDEFVAHYQPIVQLASGRIDKFEALTRWLRPDGVLVPPAQFIDVAEETGLICGIGEFIMMQAVADCAAWQRAMPRVGVNVNVSARQLAEQNVVKLARTALGAAQLPPALLTIELTESALLREPLQVVAKLHELRAMGVRVALDDFGTGYSSLTYLRTLPIDVLKIDKSFIAALSEPNDDVSIVAAIIELAHARRLDVVAEGIEKRDIAERLRRLGCEYGQGYLWARPAPFDDCIRASALMHRQSESLIPRQ